MSPYSMPLCTIFTKCPAPLGPQCSQPRSSGEGSPLRPGVRSAVPNPGAMVSQSPTKRSTEFAGPPIMRQ
ncbi:unannotated protein [freshwater metagenome]|uniref:Unannotated protein n=1 Tax=freshwater metagenome TaxID=449393 RepID=A0A6J7E2S8_9ZZZZ